MQTKEFEVRRFKSSSELGGYTLSRVYLDGKELHDLSGKQIVGLEDEFRMIKVYGETRIPAGRYRMVISLSPKFKRNLIEILNVLGFSGIRWHSGNTEDETDGCLLVGNTFGYKSGKPAVFGGQSAGVEKFITELVQGFINAGFECWVTYVDNDGAN